jgi:hypothetical protein
MQVFNMDMIIPQPQFEHVPIDMHGYSIWRQMLSRWSSPPCFKLINNWDIVLADGLHVRVPSKFVTDFASTPRILWPLIAPDGPLYLGAIIHDFGYQHGYLLSVYTEGTPYMYESLQMREKYKDQFSTYIPVYVGMPQSFFDGLLRDITIFTTGATLEATEAYVALRVFGCHAWNNYREKGPGAYGQNSLKLPGVIND